MTYRALGVAAVLALAQGAAAAPNHHNLQGFADRLINQKSRLLIVADSIWSEDSPGRMPRGVRNKWDIPWYGWTVGASPTANDTLGMVMQASNVADDLPSPPGAGFGRTALHHIPPTSGGYGEFLPGNLTVSPKRYMESRFHGDWTRFQPLWRGVLQAGHNNSSGVNQFAQFKRGSWLGLSLTATGIYFNHPSCVTQFTLVPYRDGAQTFGATVVQPFGDGVRWVTVPCNGFGEPWLQFQAHNPLVEQAYSPTGNPNSNLVILGAHFEDPNATTGSSFTTIANAGWSAGDHIDPAMCSDANLQGFLEAVGTPDLVLIQLGANVEPNEILPGGALAAQWKTNLEALIARYRSVLTPPTPNDGAAGPKFLLVSQYALDPVAYPRLPAMADAMHQVSQADPDVAFVNLYAYGGSHASLQAGGYLADGVHPSASGSDFLAERIWIAMVGAICSGDTNGDRNVDFIDLNRVLGEFGTSGSGLLGDVNNDGTVDFLDLNIILSFFGTTC